MEFEKIKLNKKLFYWTWKDLSYLPYAWLEKKDLKTLLKPFLLTEIHPDCPIGFKTEDLQDFTNIIRLTHTFDELKIDKDLKKDLRRIEKKNEQVKLVFNETGALDKSRQWFLEQWKENKKDFQRRLRIWKERAYTISAYLNNELIAVHIAMKEKDTIFYLGCWWNRKYKPLSPPIFLLKKDIERVIHSGNIKYYDLEIGDEPYKKKWGVIEKPTKYYAILTKELADYLEIKHYIEI